MFNQKISSNSDSGNDSISNINSEEIFFENISNDANSNSSSYEYEEDDANEASYDESSKADKSDDTAEVKEIFLKGISNDTNSNSSSHEDEGNDANEASDNELSKADKSNNTVKLPSSKELTFSGPPHVEEKRKNYIVTLRQKNPKACRILITILVNMLIFA